MLVSANAETSNILLGHKAQATHRNLECFQVVDCLGDVGLRVFADFAFNGEIAIVADFAEIADVERPVNPAFAQRNLAAAFGEDLGVLCIWWET